MIFTVKETRKAKGVTKRQMAALLGMAPATYQIREENPELFTIKEVMDISKALSVPTTDIIFLSGMTIQIS